MGGEVKKSLPKKNGEWSKGEKGRVVGKKR